MNPLFCDIEPQKKGPAGLPLGGTARSAFPSKLPSEAFLTPSTTFLFPYLLVSSPKKIPTLAPGAKGPQTSHTQ